jgi:sugar phosphate isomerase/epimerase
MQRLVDGCLRLCDYAEVRDVRLAFEPEPGMFIDTMGRFAQLFESMRSPRFGLTLDLGHLWCTEETPIAGYIQKWRDIVWNIHIEDMRRGVHDHLMFGEGDMDFPAIFHALANINYRGGIHVELSRHSHDAVNIAQKALEFLKSHQAQIAGVRTD